MPVADHGAHRASRRRTTLVLVSFLAAVLAWGGQAVAPEPASAATAKVVVVVGPVGGSTSTYITRAKRIAAQARSYGASVTEIYSPNATWTRVRRAAQGANLFVYLGHGNGWPSPYGPFQRLTKDGLGLNRSGGAGHHNVKYYGEYYVARYLRLAPNAVVILNHLCYASGNSEPGRALPSRSVARQRVDNYGAGFLRTGAKAVFADGRSSVAYILHGLFRTNLTMDRIFWSAPHAKRSYAFSFSSSRTRGMVGRLDPYKPGRYYRSVIGALAVTAADWR